MLECDQKAKEERVKCEEDYKNDNVRVRENTGLNHRDRCCERKASEVIKKIDIMRKLEEYFKNKYGENGK